MQGLEKGFRIGFNSTRPVKFAKHNLISASEHPEVVAAYISKEYTRGNIGLVGSLEQAGHLNIQLNPLGAIPKKDKPNKWRLIMDLSSPEGYIVNNGI